MQAIARVGALREAAQMAVQMAPPTGNVVVSVQGDYLVLRPVGRDAAGAVCAEVGDRSHSGVVSVGVVEHVRQFLARLGPQDRVRVGVGLAGPVGARVKVLTVRCGAQTLRLACV